MRLWLGNTLERLRWYRATRPQIVRAVYHVSVCNRHPDAQRVGIAIPVPFDRSNQHLSSQPVCTPKDVQFQQDAFGNTIAFWERYLQAYETLEVNMSFEMRTQPASRIENQVAVSGWMEGNRFLIPADPRILSLSRKAIEGVTSRKDQIHRLHELVMDRLTYGNPIPGLYPASEAVEGYVVDCGGFASLFCSLAISVGIPARVVSGFWTSAKNADMHAWAEAQDDDGTWIPVDSSVEQLRQLRRTKRRGSCGFVGSDRIVYSLGCGMTIRMCGLSIPVDILQHPVISAERGLSSVHQLFTHRVTRV